MRSLTIAVTILVASFAATACGERTRNARVGGAARDSIFREISFHPFAPIRLGEPLGKGSPGTVALPDGRLALVDRDFEDTDSIYLRLGAEGRVNEMTFIYSASKDMTASIADYTASLGSPASLVESESTTRRLERVVWEDKRTRFTLSRLSDREGPIRVWSTLLDRTMQH